METIFETERLAVRKFCVDDARRLYENHKDENPYGNGMLVYVYQV